MPEMKTSQFDAQWEKSLQEPAVRKATVKKVENTISVADVLDSFQELADKALKQRKVKKPDYDELSGQLARLRKLVARIGEKTLLEASQA